MAETFAAINGHHVVSLRLTVGNVGPWHAECDLAEDPNISGKVTLKIGKLSLTGTVVNNGTFGLQRRLRVVAGAAGWSKQVDAKDYHNDAGVKAKTVADDVARVVGEKIGTFIPPAERVGRDYVRQLGPASATLEDILDGVAWWVDYAGTTNAGPRGTSPVDTTDYQVLVFNPRERELTLSIDDPAKVGIGSIIVNDLDSPQVIRSFELTVNGEGMQMVAWCGGDDRSRGNLPDLLRSIVKRSMDDALFGKYKYRVTRMSGDRVELQAVRSGAGLPDLLPISMWPGVAGVHAQLTPGTEVLVEFIEGDRTQPIVSHFAGKDGAGFVPVSLVLGGATGPNAARQGDAVEVLLPPGIFTGTVGGSPATGVIEFAIPKAEGVITAGSGKVKIAT